jgi:hypothetical protein
MTARASELTRQELDALRPHVINLRNGMLATTAAGEGEYFTTSQDLEAIFESHLPAFAADHGGTVPLVLFAHGGLVTEANGLRSAHRQIPWWKENGVYPVYFVWESGVAEALGDALSGWLRGARGGVGDFKDRVVEVAARFGQGQHIWNAMKLDAEAASAPTGGAQLFADRLGTYLNDHPGAVSVHAIGHSAGAIFHTHFLAAARGSGVDRVETLTLLAPAMRTDLFKEKVMPELREDGGSVGHLNLFTMTQESEEADNCARVYGKSLLYLVRASFEPEVNASILGLQECIEADEDLRELFQSPGESRAEVVWTPGEGGPRHSSNAITHAAFDVDRATMSSVLRRILDKDDIKELLYRRTRATTWPATASPDPTPSWRVDATHKALCIGIDEYPDPSDQLAGCVADAGAWATELERTGFTVHSMTNDQATRENILLRMLELVTGSSAGDVLAIQYSGHGTTAPDLDDDEKTSGQIGNLEDEALCPVDFRTGELIIDDDLGRIWDLLPEGVSLTLFFDSCHSGSAQRKLIPLEDANQATAEDSAQGSRRRHVVLTRESRSLFRQKRGYGLAAGQPTPRTLSDTGGRRQGTPAPREMLFSACRPDEYAYETAGYGDFTRKTTPLLGTALGKLSNEAFHLEIATGFNPRQHPELHGPDSGKGRTLLNPNQTIGEHQADLNPTGSAPQIVETHDPMEAEPRTEKKSKVAALLHAFADLFEK